MSAPLNENSICNYLFEDIPSDSDSYISYDYTDDDKDYLPNKDIEIVESNDSSDDNEKQNEDDLVEILNLDAGNILLLPSPVKTRHSQRSSISVTQSRHSIQKNNIR